MNERQLFLLLCYAISAASRPDSKVRLQETHIHKRRPPKDARRKPMPPKRVRRWKGVYEHKDTPLF